MSSFLIWAFTHTHTHTRERELALVNKALLLNSLEKWCLYYQYPCLVNSFFYFIQDYVPENLDSAAEFEAPQSPDSTYGQSFPAEEDFAKEPAVVPPQLHLTVLGMENSDEASLSSSKPQHVVLNHLFIEKGWASQSVVALGVTHRFQSKYVTVCLYKPLKR